MSQIYHFFNSTTISKVFLSLFLTLGVSFSTFAFDEDQLISMDERYRKFDIRNGVYLKESELVKFEYYFNNGLLYSANTGKLASFWFEQNIVISREGRIYIMTQNPFVLLHHSSPVEGDKVFFAGEVVIKKGKIKFLTNGSGHYKPKSMAIYNLLNYLNSIGVDVSDIEIGIYSGSKLNSTVSQIRSSIQFIKEFNLYKQKLCLNYYK